MQNKILQIKLLYNNVAIAMFDIEKALVKSKALIIKSSKSYDALVKPVSTGESFMQLIVYDDNVTQEYIQAAYVNALASFEEHRNIAKSIGLEFLLYAAMTDQIDYAIKKMAPKQGKPFIIITNDSELLKDVEKHCRLSPFNPKASSRAKLMETLEKMSMARLHS